MKFAKRSINPIFVEDEGYNWKTRKPVLLRLMTMAMLGVALTSLVLLVVN